MGREEKKESSGLCSEAYKAFLPENVNFFLQIFSDRFAHALEISKIQFLSARPP